MWNLTTDLRFINEPEPNFEYFYVIRILAGIQLIAEILTILHVFYVLILFIQIRVCHIHFRILICIFLVDLLLKAVANIVVLSKHLTGITFLTTSAHYFYANLIQCTANYLYYFYPLSIFVERTIPLIWTKGYENYFSLIFVAASLLFPIMCAVYLTVHLLFLQEWLPILTIYFITNSFMISSWGAYFFIYFFSKNTPKNNKVQTVSERYQRFENLRTHKTMNWFVLACIIGLLLAAAYIQFLLHYKLWFPNISEINMVAVTRILLDTAEAYLFLLIPIAFAFTHEKLKKKYLKIFQCFKPPTRVTSVTIEMQVIKSINGENMNFDNQQDHYFQSLKSEWDSKLNKKLQK